MIGVRHSSLAMHGAAGARLEVSPTAMRRDVCSRFRTAHPDARRVLRVIGGCLRAHLPYTAGGAVGGIILLSLATHIRIPSPVADALERSLFPLCALLAAAVISAMCRWHGSRGMASCMLVGYAGGVLAATATDAAMLLAGRSLGFVEPSHALDFVTKWWIATPPAALGFCAGYFRRQTQLPHAAHALVLTVASILFVMTAAGSTRALSILSALFILPMVVLAMCVLTDLVFPLVLVHATFLRRVARM